MCLVSSADYRLHHRRHGALLRHQNGAPTACLLFSKPIDSLAAAGAILSGVWTATPMPTIDNLGDEFLDAVSTGDAITVTEDGTVIVG